MKLSLKERVEKVMETYSLNKNQLSVKTGINYSAIHDWVTEGRLKLSAQNIERIIRAFPELNAEWLRTGEGEMVKAPVVEAIPAEQVFAELKNQLEHERRSNEFMQREIEFLRNLITRFAPEMGKFKALSELPAGKVIEFKSQTENEEPTEERA